MQDDNKVFWQKTAKIYTSSMKKSEPLYDDICERMKPYLKGDMNILELACGTGQLSFKLAGKVKLWEATDFSENMIAEAEKQKGSARLHFSVADATALPYSDSAFDGVVIANALHIMPEPQKALDEIHRVLKDDGILFAPTFTYTTNPAARIRIAIMSAAGFKTYYKWTAEELETFIKSKGFSIIKSEMTGTKLMPLDCLIAKKQL